MMLCPTRVDDLIAVMEINAGYIPLASWVIAIFVNGDDLRCHG